MSALFADRPDWMLDGACRDHPVDLFFPARGGDVSAPKKICEGCPVREECADYAVVNGEKFGIWGGLSELERRPLRRQRSIAHGTAGGYAAHRRRGEQTCRQCLEAHTAAKVAAAASRRQLASVPA